MKINVKGHSGCSVNILNDVNGLYIEKTTFDKKYTRRLKLQAEKQDNAAKLKYQHIRIPEIYEINQGNDFFTIKMEYIYSRNFIEHFEQSGFEQINYFIKALCGFVEAEIAESVIENCSVKVFIEKYKSVKKELNNNCFVKENYNINKLLKKIDIEFLKMPELVIPIGTCHGDLTFSNILFNGNNYYLIDFLDSFIETPLMDIVKIRQDSKYLWSQLMYTKNFDKVRLNIISRKIDKEIDAFFSKYEWYNIFYKPFQIMNLLRILQYAREEEIVKYLLNAIEETLYEREFNNPSC